MKKHEKTGSEKMVTFDTIYHAGVGCSILLALLLAIIGECIPGLSGLASAMPTIWMAFAGTIGAFVVARLCFCVAMFWKE